ncbi:hypothetical protein KM043_004543 [Ampulex compressa]|nr:hypothetical protein KM043_004543 [Ampulex compressa]
MLGWRALAKFDRRRGQIPVSSPQRVVDILARGPGDPRGCVIPSRASIENPESSVRFTRVQLGGALRAKMRQADNDGRVRLCVDVRKREDRAVDGEPELAGAHLCLEAREHLRI